MTSDDDVIDAAERARLDADHRAIDDLSPAQPTGPSRIDDDARDPAVPGDEPPLHVKDEHGHRMTH
jgi:hypothetical protein